MACLQSVQKPPAICLCEFGECDVSSGAKIAQESHIVSRIESGPPCLRIATSKPLRRSQGIQAMCVGWAVRRDTPFERKKQFSEVLLHMLPDLNVCHATMFGSRQSRMSSEH
jgi:hypothetical protein